MLTDCNNQLNSTYHLCQQQQSNTTPTDTHTPTPPHRETTLTHETVTIRILITKYYTQSIHKRI